MIDPITEEILSEDLNNSSLIQNKFKKMLDKEMKKCKKDGGDINKCKHKVTSFVIKKFLYKYGNKSN